MEVKLGDFGLAAKLDFDGEKKRTICGTPNYIAPEILEGKNGHSYEADAWSLGVIIYTLIIGKPPFETTDVKQTYKRIRANNYNFPESAVISESAKNLIQKILVNDPKQRLGMNEILSHEFLSGSVPKTLPNSCLACPPQSNFIKQYLPFGNTNPSNRFPNRLEGTAPAKEVGSKFNPAKTGGFGGFGGS
jgi:polo-like kinase 1